METALPSHPNNRKRYLLAKASNRIFSRVIDTLIIVSICVGISILIIIGDSEGLKSANNLHDHWRYLVITLITTILFFCYFIVLPFFWNGRTLGMALLKLKIYNLIQTKNFFLNLIKREFFLWMICIVANIVLGFGLINSNPKDIFDAFFKFQNSQQQIIVVIVQAIQMIGIIIIIFVIIHMCIFNRRRCFIDHVSDTCVIKFVDVNSKEANDALNAIRKNQGPQRRYRLPGEISDSASEEIDSL